jgi:hypothetical protein
MEERIQAIEVWLDHTVDLTEMLADDESFCTELRGVVGGGRKKKNDIFNEAENLRARMLDRSHQS